MLRFLNSGKKIFLLSAVCIFCFIRVSVSQNKTPKFKVIAFSADISHSETAHVSFVHEANKWFSQMAARYNFAYDSTNNWNDLNEKFLSNYEVVIFLNARPDSSVQRAAFRKYMEAGGAWMGFHFAGFALTPSAVPQNWDWYHNQFLGSGEYKGNTWRPTTAILRVENHNHPSTRNLPDTFIAAPNEWYSWKNDLRKNPDIQILLSVDSTSFPLGTGPKLYEIWHSGYYPVVWTNKKFNMIYFNMGHNDLDFENKTNMPLSSTFSSENQNKLLIDALLWLGKEARDKR